MKRLTGQFYLSKGPFKDFFSQHLSNLVLTVACYHFVGAVSDVEMQEHYDEFFEVSDLFCLF